MQISYNRDVILVFLTDQIFREIFKLLPIFCNDIYCWTEGVKEYSNATAPPPRPARARQMPGLFILETEQNICI